MRARWTDRPSSAGCGQIARRRRGDHRPRSSCAPTSATAWPTTGSIPGVVVLPETAEQVAGGGRACAEAGVPFVARGSGTGLSGGALPHADGVLIVHVPHARASSRSTSTTSGPWSSRACINLQVTKAAAPHGYYYAPDPSSQQVCSIGGNVAENSGGAHCLKYGFTTNHVTGLEVVAARRRAGPARRQGARPAGLRPARRVRRLGGHARHRHRGDRAAAAQARGGADPAGRVRRHRRRPATRSRRSSAAGIVPAAIEMMDALAIEAAEAAVHCDYPERRRRGADRRAGRARGRGRARSSPRSSGSARRPARSRSGSPPTTTERALFWKGRKSAFAAVGRISPDYIVQDGVIPRTALPEVLRRIAELADERGRAGGQRLPRRRRQPAPAGALRRRGRRARPSGPRRCPARSSTSASSTAARSPASTASASDKASTCRACSPPTTWTPCSWCAARSTPTGWPTRARCSRPRGCAARCPAAHRGPPGRAGRPGGGVLSRGPSRTLERGGAGPAAAERGTTRSTGSPAGLVARPRSVAEASQVLRGGRRRRPGRRLAGGGTQARAGRRRPQRVDLVVDTARLDRVVEHAAGDLVVRAQAGVPLAELQAAAGPGRPAARPRPARARRHRRRRGRGQRLRPAPAALRHRPRPAHRHHRRAGRRHGRPGRRQGGQERRRLRPGQAVLRLATARSAWSPRPPSGCTRCRRPRPSSPSPVDAPDRGRAGASQRLRRSRPRAERGRAGRWASGAGRAGSRSCSRASSRGGRPRRRPPPSCSARSGRRPWPGRGRPTPP